MDCGFFCLKNLIYCFIVKIIKILLSNGAILNAKDEKGFTALKHAELSNAKDAVQVLKQV